MPRSAFEVWKLIITFNIVIMLGLHALGRGPEEAPLEWREEMPSWLNGAALCLPLGMRDGLEVVSSIINVTQLLMLITPRRGS
jgi:hypothetical protein